MKIETIGIVGAGVLGASLAQSLAPRYAVRIVDTHREALNRAESAVRRHLKRAEDEGQVPQGEWKQLLARATFSTDLEALRGPEVILEAVVEDPSAKTEVFRHIDRIAVGEALVATTSSTVPVTRLAAVTKRAARIVGFHFPSPYGKLDLVELVVGVETTAETVDDARLFLADIGKTAVVVRDRPGLVSQRMLLALINEAIRCVEEGVADADAVERVATGGLHLAVGPLKLADQLGLDECLRGLDALQRETGDPKYRPSPLLRRMVDAGRLGRKSGMGFFHYIDDRR